MMRRADQELKAAWQQRFRTLPEEARQALREALVALRADAGRRAQHQWSKHKAPMAAYWKVVAVYAGHLARTLR